MTLCWALNFFALLDFFGGFHLEEMDKVLETQEREAILNLRLLQSTVRAGFLYSADLRRFQSTSSSMAIVVKNGLVAITKILCCACNILHELSQPKVLLNELWRHADYMLPLPVLHQVQALNKIVINSLQCWLHKYLQGGDDVTLSDAGHSAEVLDAEGAPEVPEDLEKDPGPI